MAETTRGKPDERKIYEINKERWQLQKAGRWTVAEYERLYRDLKEAAGGDGQPLVDFEMSKPDV